MEAMGVFSSWETLETNSCREASRAFILPSTTLNASAICRVSRYSGAETGLLEKPALTLAIDWDSFSKGVTRRIEKTKDSTMMMTTMISSISRADRVSRSRVVRIFSVDTLASRTPWEAPDSVGWGSPEWSPLSRDRVSVMGMAIRI